MFLCEKISRTVVKGNGVKGKASPETEPDFYSMSEVMPDHESLEFNKRLEKTVARTLSRKECCKLSQGPSGDELSINSANAISVSMPVKKKSLTSCAVSVSKPEKQSYHGEEPTVVLPTANETSYAQSYVVRDSIPSSLDVPSVKEVATQIIHQDQRDNFYFVDQVIPSRNSIQDHRDIISQTWKVISSAQEFLETVKKENANGQLPGEAAPIQYPPQLAYFDEAGTATNASALQPVQEFNLPPCHHASNHSSFDDGMVGVSTVSNTPNLSPSPLPIGYADNHPEFDPDFFFFSESDFLWL